MLESKLPLQSSFIRHVFTKRGRQSPHDVGGELHEETHEEEPLAANAAGEGVVVDDHVEDGLGEVRVELSKTVGELGHVDGDELVGILYPIVERREAVKGHIGEVLLVDVVRQTCPILQRELALMIG